MKIVYEFFNCGECPYCEKGYSYRTDGRGYGRTVFVCKKGAFGGYEHGGYAYAYGKTITEIKNGIDKQCPLEDINL